VLVLVLLFVLDVVPVLLFVLDFRACSGPVLVTLMASLVHWRVMATNILLPHEKLLAYQFAMQLLQQVQGMRVVDSRLRDQLLRAAKSVCLNIAEGVGRFSSADKKRVYAIARGECCEAAAAIDIARAAGECDPEQGSAARETAGRVYALLTGLIRRYDSETIGPKTSHEHQLDEHQKEHEHERELNLEHEKEHEHLLELDLEHEDEHEHKHKDG
jgi:four helix bundle protein